MYVVCVPAINDTVSEWLHGLDPDHGRWLVKSGDEVQKDQVVFEHHYWDFYQSDFWRMFKDAIGVPKDVRVKFKAPVGGKITIRDFFSGQVRRHREYNTAPSIHDAESLRRYGPALWITTSQKYAGAGIDFYQSWFDAIESNHKWLEATLRKSATFSNMTNAGRPEREWIDLLERERQYLLRYQCPVFTEPDFKSILSQ